MKYANIKKFDIADGPGVRVSLFVSGCLHHCQGCFNKIAWDFDYGNEFNKNVENELIESLKPSYIEGLTLLGGEPFEPANQRGLIDFLKRVKELYPNKTIWCYTGFLFDEELLKPSRARCEVTDQMLELIDVLVDGKFVLSLKNISLMYRGSSNQRIIDVKKSLKENKVILIEEYI